MLFRGGLTAPYRPGHHLRPGFRAGKYLDRLFDGCVCTSKPEKESVNRVRTPDTGGSEWSLLWTATEDSGSAGAIRFARAEAHVAADPYLVSVQKR